MKTLKWGLAVFAICQLLLSADKVEPIEDYVSHAVNAELTETELRIHVKEGNILTGMTVSNILLVRPLIQKKQLIGAIIDPKSNMLMTHDNINETWGKDEISINEIVWAFADASIIPGDSYLTAALSELEQLKVLEEWPYKDSIISIPLLYIPDKVLNDLKRGKIIVAVGNEVGDYVYFNVGTNIIQPQPSFAIASQLPEAEQYDVDAQALSKLGGSVLVLGPNSRGSQVLYFYNMSSFENIVPLLVGKNADGDLNWVSQPTRYLDDDNKSYEIYPKARVAEMKLLPIDYIMLAQNTSKCYRDDICSPEFVSKDDFAILVSSEGGSSLTLKKQNYSAKEFILWNANTNIPFRSTNKIFLGLNSEKDLDSLDSNACSYSTIRMSSELLCVYNYCSDLLWLLQEDIQLRIHLETLLEDCFNDEIEFIVAENGIAVHNSELYVACETPSLILRLVFHNGTLANISPVCRWTGNNGYPIQIAAVDDAIFIFVQATGDLQVMKLD